MITFPNAKINLGLHITGNRADGYHNIETVFYPIPYCDILEIVQTGNRFKFTCTGLPVPGVKNTNLAAKAYRLLQKDYELQPVQIHLHKLIPPGAGLGGGSSDGIFALKLLDDILNLKLSGIDMIKYADMLGSDCAFFLKNKPVFASGRGNIFKSIDVSLSGFYLVLAIPPVRIPTAEAYKNTQYVLRNESLFAIIKSPIGKWKKLIVNDFEDYAFKKIPLLKELKEKLYSQGAVYASMTGSGSAIFGLFEDKVNVNKMFPGMNVHLFSM